MMFSKSERYGNGISFASIELDKYFIDYIPNERNVLFITFENADRPNRPRLDRFREPWGLRPIRDLGCCVLGIKPKSVDWYRGRDLHEFFRSAVFAAFRSSFHRIVLYGSSMGGYGALTFAAACPGGDVLSINPQTTLDPALVPWEMRYPQGKAQDWSGDFADAAIGSSAARKVHVAYDPLLALDRRHVERLPTGNLVSLKTPLLGHSLPAWLLQMGILKDLVAHVADGRLDQETCNVLARRRKAIPRYYTGLALKSRRKDLAESALRALQARHRIDDATRSDMLEACRKHELWEMAAHLFQDLIPHRIETRAQAVELAKKLRGLGKQAAAQKLLDTVLAIAPHDAGALIATAENLWFAGDPQGAEQVLREVTNTDPRNAHAFRLLARISWKEGKRQEAVLLARTATTLDPSHFVGHYEHGSYLLEESRCEEAADALRKAVAIYPRHEAAANKLAQCLGKLAA